MHLFNSNSNSVLIHVRLSPRCALCSAGSGRSQEVLGWHAARVHCGHPRQGRCPQLQHCVPRLAHRLVELPCRNVRAKKNWRTTIVAKASAHHALRCAHHPARRPARLRTLLALHARNSAVSLHQTHHLLGGRRLHNTLHPG